VVQQTGVRWGMPATVSGRAFSGTSNTDPVRASSAIEELCQQTGLTCERLNGALAFHRPQDEARRKLVAQASEGDRRQRLETIARLGWLRDLHAWPELARIVAGDDVELALAAAQAMRRLDGEEALDWRLFGVSASDPELVDMSVPVPAWQVPVGFLFPDAASTTATCSRRSAPIPAARGA
jgi:hypothetical protein